MAFKINWTQRASRDLAAIAVHIAAERSDAAVREAGNILRKVDLLARFPEMGPIYRRTPQAEFRSVVSGNYRIVYRIRLEEPTVDIVTVRHGARDEPEFN